MNQRAAPALSGERFRAVFRLALPIIAGMGSQNLLNLVDTAMVGSLGTASLAAVGISSMAVWVITSVLQGLGPAVQAVTARRLGEGKIERLHQAMVNAGYLVILVGIPYTWLLLELVPVIFGLLTTNREIFAIGVSYTNIRLYTVVIIGVNFCFRGYFNGRKQSILYMQTLLLMHPINMVLNFLLIFGHLGLPAMGADGAALGTAIATTLGCLNYIRLMLKHRNKSFSMSPRELSTRTMGALVRIGLPSCVQILSLALGYLVFFRIAELVGPEALAATNVLINLNLVCILVSLGLGIATITLVGNALGEGKPAEARQWVKSTAFIACTGMAVIGSILAAFPTTWLTLFTREEAVISIAVIPLVLMGLSQVLDAAGIILSHAHLGGGASKTVMIISFVNQWLILLPACYIWVTWFQGELLQLWICMVIYRLLQVVSYLISIRRGGWLKVAL
ncbi:MAG: MATE family efflux transporter [Acidobacteriota bacterium]|nr:MATE family efflux transporter [Acidobacteriota bacterium]